MDILNYKVYIFNLNAILIKGDTSSCATCSQNYRKNELAFVPGFFDFFNFLISLKMHVYIIADSFEENVDITSTFPVILQSTITFSNNIRESYMKIVKQHLNKDKLCNIISFENLQNQSILKDIVYNVVFIGQNCQFVNTISDFISIKSFVYKKNFEYIPFYVSSKTIHRCKWNELKTSFPVLASWTECDKSKDDMNEIEKMRICSLIEDDISNSSFGIFYIEKNDTDHIGSLIETGILIGQNKPVFLCGDNKFLNEVLFHFKNLINTQYIDNFNLRDVIRNVQHEVNPFYAEFEENLITTLEYSLP